MTLADTKPCACPDDRAILCEVLGHGDMCLYWQCRDCEAAWHRFAADAPYYRAKAARAYAAARAA